MWVFFLWGRETFCKKFYFTFAAKYNYIVIQISCVVVKLFIVGARRVPTPQPFKNLRVGGEKLFSYNQLRFGVVYVVVVKDNFAVSVGDDFAA